MKSKGFFEEFVADLTELEMASLLEAAAHELKRNRMTHLVNDAFHSSEIDDLESEKSDLEYDLSECEREKDDIEGKANRALEYLIEGNVERAKNILAAL